jgi:hypothetical protein
MRERVFGKPRDGMPASERVDQESMIIFGPGSNRAGFHRVPPGRADPDVMAYIFMVN